MKTRFNTFDIICSVTELQRLVGMRVSNVYDVDNKTYLIKLQRTEEKSILLIESGNRFHTSAFEWPKNVAPSGFSMKMRKHLRNKRLECLKQLGVDRIVDFQFGSGEAAYHVILELYDRGNIVLTDYEMTILNVLRPHTEGETVRFAVKEKYPTNRAKEKTGPLTIVELTDALKNAKQGESLKKLLNPILVYGPAIIDHVLLSAGFTSNCKLGKGFIINRDIPKLLDALKEADKLLDSASEHVSKGYIIQKKEERPSTDVNEKEYIFTNQEFHPMLFTQHGQSPYREFPTFDTAVDEFFSTFEGQKIDMRALQQEREALKKLENVRKDHAQRLVALEQTQENDKQKAELITKNQVLVDNAILAIRSAIANQLSWPDIQALVLQAAESGDSVASIIKQFKLEINHISLLLGDPFARDGEADEDALKPILIDIDLGTSAFGNARKYYDQKRTAAKKQQKTVESHGKALKSAEKKTKQTLKEVQAITNINKARKVYWFEKFFWFISSENFLVIGGRDQQQNELIVKRYMRPGDVYVHADVHGASSVIVKNPSTEPVPPKTLNEAGTMAICYSVAWEAKVITSAWWVHSNQVSKTAPTGEYLTTGSFMVRGKKNYLPPCHLIMGLSFLFKLDDTCVERHRNERRVRTIEEETIESLQRVTMDVDAEVEDDEEIELESEGESHPTDDRLGKEDLRVESDSGDDMKFPDTHIKIEHFTETKIDIRMESKTPILTRQSGEDVIYLGDDEPIFLNSSRERSSGKIRSESKSKNLKKNIKEENECGSNIQQQNHPKRGQKGKLKKIKEKYKDQDDEERAMRMKILQSAGAAKEGKKMKKKEHKVVVDRCKRKGADREPKVPQSQVPDGLNIDDQLGADDDKEEIVVNADVDMLDSLTGNPFPDDEILFAIPVVAPYNTLQNYKYKVKLMPGTGRRGKASKTAVSIFLQERMTTQREKDLLRSVKDENIARNIPGKVKLSAPKLLNVKKQSNFVHRS